MHVDIAIFGGGACGLWCLDELVRQGYQAILIERYSLGHGQTISAQGIIHGGLKYTLRGLLTSSAKSIREMPGLWSRAYTGETGPDLSHSELRGESCYLWRTSDLSSALGMVGARLGLRVTPNRLSQQDRPELLKTTPGDVFELPEQVISPRSFLHSLSETHSNRLFAIDELPSFEQAESQSPYQVTLRHSGESLTFQSDRLLFTAGAGNEVLRSQLGLGTGKMQLRPLHMVMMRGKLPIFQGHCVDGAQTRMTITSEQTSEGDVVWQLGGQLAENGVSMTSEELIVKAESELKQVFPNVEWPEGLQMATYRVTRAEGITATGVRPDQPVNLIEGRHFTSWPTKMAFAPRVAAEVCEYMQQTPELTSSAPKQVTEQQWFRPPVSANVWEQAAEWTPVFTQAQQRSSNVA